MRILIIEDEDFFADMIKSMVKDMGHDVVGLAQTEAKAFKMIHETECDLVILDVNLEGNKEGLKLAKNLREEKIPFMFLTSFADSATLEEAKNSLPGSYLVKPFNEKELKASIEMALMHASVNKERVIRIKDGYKTVLLYPEDVLYVKADNLYIEVYTKTKKIVSRQTLMAFFEMLPPEQFVRVHRSFIVNKQNVDSVSNNRIEIGQTVIPVSRSFKPALKTAFGLD
jgi:two-component system, LytTR family, response regulator LytT